MIDMFSAALQPSACRFSSSRVGHAKTLLMTNYYRADESTLRELMEDMLHWLSIRHRDPCVAFRVACKDAVREFMHAQGKTVAQ